MVRGHAGLALIALTQFGAARFFARAVRTDWSDVDSGAPRSSLGPSALRHPSLRRHAAREIAVGRRCRTVALR
jgi:hypothetical protein